MTLEQEQQHAFSAQAKKLSDLRKKKAASFQTAVGERMHALGIKEGELSIVFQVRSLLIPFPIKMCPLFFSYCYVRKEFVVYSYIIKRKILVVTKIQF